DPLGYLGDGVFGSDALTVNPYLGRDSLEPFVDQAAANGRGLFVLVKTSNPGSRDLQDLTTTDDRPVYLHTAALVGELGRPYRDEDGYSPVGAVVGATHPQVLREVRRALPYSVLLVPGYGAQGARAEDVAGAFDADGAGGRQSSLGEAT
ncbi:MAG: orotidine-5'-phosphate decarboxylase, partial [Trueperaceae bacterium]|nr:orotidine-5'-phosphate decarboxylase [Trueperaceae bacterium]